MVTVLVTCLIILVVAVVIDGIIWYAPFIPATIKTWLLWIVGGLALIGIVLQVAGLFTGSAH